MTRSLRHIAACIPATFLYLGHGGAMTYAQENDIPTLFKPDTLTVIFMGDMMMHTAQIENALKGDGTYDFSSYFSLLEEEIGSADLAVANMEFTLSGPPYSGYPCFSAPDSFAGYLAEIGFDVFLAANNHIFDKGGEGAARTVEKYRELESQGLIRFTGLAEDLEARNRNTPLMLRRKGIRLAFVNMTYGTNCGSGTHWPKTNYSGETSLLADALGKAEAEADLTIVLPHWGNEYSLIHSEAQEKTAEWLIEKGADLIIGAHPHVVQDKDVINGTDVIYSMGNAVSNMSAANTQIELMVTLRIAIDGYGDMTMLPLEETWLWCSRPGGYGSAYTVLPVEEFIGRRDEWSGSWDYDKMVSTYERVRKTTR